MSEGGLSLFRVTRIIRRPRALGALAARATTGREVSPESLLHMATIAPFLAATPELIPVFAAIAALTYLQSFYQPIAQTIVLPTSFNRPWEYADQMRRLTLLKLYGPDDGDKIYTAQFSHRSLEIDMRSRSP